MSSCRFLVNEPSVISEIIDGEVIVLNFGNGHYYSLNRVASFVWSGLAGGCVGVEISAALAARCGLEPAAIAPAVEEFVALLVAEGLVRPGAEPAGEGALPEAPPAGEFEPPAFEKFTDMEQLLLLDPIHEVTDAGWPHGRRS